jgi:hypothetical protein
LAPSRKQPSRFDTVSFGLHAAAVDHALLKHDLQASKQVAPLNISVYSSIADQLPALLLFDGPRLLQRAW